MASLLPKAFPPAIVPDYDGGEAETKTICPACKGCGKSELIPTGPSVYRWVACSLCKGEGLIVASKASGWRLRNPLIPWRVPMAAPED